eukprot:3427176-Karenia_brevis.AAC.1
MLASLSSVGKRGDAPFNEIVSEQGSVKRAGQYLATELDGGSSPVEKVSPSLWHWSWLELGVSDVTAPTFSRVIMWMKSFRIWAGLSAVDVKGIMPNLMRLTDGGLVVQIDRAKTIGPGRKIRWMT